MTAIEIFVITETVYFLVLFIVLEIELSEVKRMVRLLLKRTDGVQREEEAQQYYEAMSAMRDYCEAHEPTYNPEDGSM